MYTAPPRSYIFVILFIIVVGDHHSVFFLLLFSLTGYAFCVIVDYCLVTFSFFYYRNLSYIAAQGEQAGKAG